MNIKKMIMDGPGALFGERLYTDLASMESTLAEMCADAGDLSGGLKRVVTAGGKRLRPMLAWVCWSMSGRRMEIVPLMCMLEFMHTTSLIHDDFVDEASVRRGVQTINAQSGGLAALESGDYLLARAMEYLKVYRGTGINEALSKVAQEMCLGELDQHAGLFHAHGSTESQYFLRIRRKTAILMAESCRSGAVAGGADETLSQALFDYGIHLGLAFQLRDDYLDCIRTAETGKSVMQDLRSGVITIPVIFALERHPDTLLSIVENPRKTEADMETVLQIVHDTGAIETTRLLLQEECRMATDFLHTLPASAETKSLALLAKSISEVSNSG